MEIDFKHYLLVRQAREYQGLSVSNFINSGTKRDFTNNMLRIKLVFDESMIANYDVKNFSSREYEIPILKVVYNLTKILIYEIKNRLHRPCNNFDGVC